MTIEMTLNMRCHDAHSESRSGDSLEKVISPGGGLPYETDRDARRKF